MLSHGELRSGITAPSDCSETLPVSRSRITARKGPSHEVNAVTGIACPARWFSEGQILIYGLYVKSKPRGACFLTADQSSLSFCSDFLYVFLIIHILYAFKI